MGNKRADQLLSGLEPPVREGISTEAIWISLLLWWIARIFYWGVAIRPDWQEEWTFHWISSLHCCYPFSGCLCFNGTSLCLPILPGIWCVCNGDRDDYIVTGICPTEIQSSSQWYMSDVVGSRLSAFCIDCLLHYTLALASTILCFSLCLDSCLNIHRSRIPSLPPSQQR